MNFTTILSSKFENSAQTISALNSLRELIVSKINHLVDFVSGLASYASIYVQTDEGISRLVAISDEQYVQACEDDNAEIEVTYDDQGSNIELTGSQIADAVEEQIGDLKCQEQFLNYCLTVENVNSTEFISRVRGLCPTIPGVIIEKFSNFIDTAGSPVDCLKNFISSIFNGGLQQEDNYITLVNKDDYIGNIYLVAISEVAETVASFFDGIWEGIQHIDKFFKNLAGAFVALGKWAIGKLFSQFLTYYEKGSGAVAGIMDLPLFQVHFTRNQLNTVLNGFASTGYDYFSWDHYNHRIDSVVLLEQSINMADAIEALTFDVFEGKKYASISEIIVPSKYQNYFDICLRIGRDEDGIMILSAYAVSNYGAWSKYSDDEIIDVARVSLELLFREISSVIPIFKDKQNVDDTSIHWSEFVDKIFERNSTGKELAECVLCYDSLNTISDEEVRWAMFATMIYMCVFSKGFKTYTGANLLETDYTNTILQNVIFSATNSLYPLTSSELDFMIPLDQESLDLSVINTKTYRPYSKTSVLGVTIHYQTTLDRAHEIISLVKAIVIAVVAIVAAVKITKWLRARKREGVLLHANVDRLSWDVMSNPTDQNVAAFNKAYSKMRRFDIVQNLLGTVVSNGSNLIQASTQAMTTGLGKISSITSRKLDTTDGKVDNNNNLVVQVRRLIKAD